MTELRLAVARIAKRSSKNLLRKSSIVSSRRHTSPKWLRSDLGDLTLDTWQPECRRCRRKRGKSSDLARHKIVVWGCRCAKVKKIAVKTVRLRFSSPVQSVNYCRPVVARECEQSGSGGDFRSPLPLREVPAPLRLRSQLWTCCYCAMKYCNLAVIMSKAREEKRFMLTDWLTLLCLLV